MVFANLHACFNVVKIREQTRVVLVHFVRVNRCCFCCRLHIALDTINLTHRHRLIFRRLLNWRSAWQLLI